MSDTRFKSIHVLVVLAAVAAVLAAGGLTYKAQAQEGEEDRGNDNNGNAADKVALPPVATAYTYAGAVQGTRLDGFVPLEIDGSVNITDQIMSGAEISFAEAAEIAADSPNGGQVLNGNLGAINGFLVYSFSLIDDENRIYSIIVDAGNGEILHTSEPMDIAQGAVASAIIGGPTRGVLLHSFGDGHQVVFYKVIDKAEAEQDYEE